MRCSWRSLLGTGRRTVGEQQQPRAAFVRRMAAKKANDEGSGKARRGPSVDIDNDKSPKKAKVASGATREALVRCASVSTVRREVPNGRSRFTVASWNVAGLRSFWKKDAPEAEKKMANLRRIWEEERPDVLFLAEHKLQESHCEEAEAKIVEGALGGASGFQGEVHWNCSTAKKGYSGVACILRHRCRSTSSDDAPKNAKQTSIKSFFGGGAGSASTSSAAPSAGDLRSIPFTPRVVTFGVGGPKTQDAEYNKEGRAICVEFDEVFVVSAYVPNSGQDLKRLDYRLGTWERDMNAYLSSLDRIKPVIYIGDLNVAHLDRDIWNVDAKHVPKSAGCTPQERSAFGSLLENCGLVDSFRHFNPDADHWYSYWSMRAGNYAVNRGLRLDYALISSRCAETGAHESHGVALEDSFLVSDINIDHCPCGITVSASDPQN